MLEALSDEALLARLVSFDSVSRNGNRAIADFVCNYMDTDGIRIERMPNEDGERVNLIILAGPKGQDRTGLVLSGHLDVVPADEPDWTSDPFRMRVQDERFVGRGTCDMKGFIALAMNRLRTADGLQAPLVLILTHDEEIGSVGAGRLHRDWNDRGPLPDSAIIGEPTSLRVVRMHKGHLKMRFSVEGTGAHSGSPHLGVNAIETAGRLVVALTEHAETLKRQRSETSTWFPSVPYPVLTVATIQGGSALNIIPAHCVIQVGLRLMPGADTGEAVRTLTTVVESVPTACRVTAELINDNPPMLTADDAPVNRELCSLIGQTTSLGVSFASDAGALCRDFDMACVLFGPGNIEVAHKPDEFLPISEFQRARNLLDQSIASRCRVVST